MAKTFIALSSEKLAELIRSAEKRVAIVAPSIHLDVGEALCEAALRLGTAKIDLIVDLNEKVFRLGYGCIEAIKLLKENEIQIRHHKGLRIGLAIIDDQAWAFSPVALYIETEPEMDDLPNAVALSTDEAKKIIMRISDSARIEILRTESKPEILEAAQLAKVELSQFSNNSGKLEEICKSLKDAPPVPFDVSRQVQVFEPYIQYVELSLKGCSIQSHKIKLPKSVMGLSSSSDIEKRLSTTFSLVEKSSSLSSKGLDDQVRRLRDVFTRSLGTLGRVLLKAQRINFDAQVDKIRTEIKLHQDRIEQELEYELAISMNQLLGYYLPIVLEKPPLELQAQITTQKPTREHAIRWLIDAISSCIPDPEKLIGSMDLECNFKDVTFETLKDKDLAGKLKEAFPHVDWTKPFNEFTAAKETVPGKTS
jgi:hypothetical protein